MWNLDKERDFMNYRWELTVKVMDGDMSVETADRLMFERFGLKNEISSRFEHCSDWE